MDIELFYDCCCETCHHSIIIKYDKDGEIEELKCDKANKLTAIDDWCEWYL